MIDPIQIQKNLGGIDFPVTKEELLEKAKEEGADENIVHKLENTEKDRFDGPEDVSAVMNKD